MKTPLRIALLWIAVLGLPVAAWAQPPQPTREHVMHGLSAVSDDVARCGDGSRAIRFQVQVVFRGATGQAIEVELPETTFRQGTLDCVRAAVLRARVPPFREEQFTVSFPFRL